MVGVSFEPVDVTEADALADLRVEAMRASLVQAGRFHPRRARERFLNNFVPENTFHISTGGIRVGVVVVRIAEGAMNLDHLYILPDYQGKGVGGQVLQWVFGRADAMDLPVNVGALAGSDSNRFYLRHGFEVVQEAEFDVYYRRRAKSEERTMNVEEFEQLVDEHKDSVYRQMIRVCNHQQDAEDALATALLLAFQSMDRLGSNEAFRSWLGVIGTRVCGKMRSHPAMKSVWEFAEEHHLLAASGNESDIELMKSCVRDALVTLDPKYREVYVACEIEECTVSEAAEKLDVTEAAAKSRLLRARAMVRHLLDSSVCGG